MTTRSLHLADAVVAFACQHQRDAKREQECWCLAEAIGEVRQAVKRRVVDDSSVFMDGPFEGLE